MKMSTCVLVSRQRRENDTVEVYVCVRERQITHFQGVWPMVRPQNDFMAFINLIPTSHIHACKTISFIPWKSTSLANVCLCVHLSGTWWLYVILTWLKQDMVKSWCVDLVLFNQNWLDTCAHSILEQCGRLSVVWGSAGCRLNSPLRGHWCI